MLLRHLATLMKIVIIIIIIIIIGALNIVLGLSNHKELVEHLTHNISDRLDIAGKYLKGCEMIECENLDWI
jgi:hypothetical protein